MKTSNEQLELVRALVKLSGLSARQHAINCGVVYTNFSAALRGNRSFPETKWPILLRQLGIPDMVLDTREVQFWQVGADLEPLKVAIASLFPNGARFEGVWRQGGGIWDMRRALDNVMFAITDGDNHRILVKRSGVGFMVHLNPEPVTPETIPQLQWRTGHPDVQSMLSIPDTQYTRWTIGNITTDEFDAAWSSSVVPVTWNQVISFAQECNLTPSEALDILKSSEVIQAWQKAQE